MAAPRSTGGPRSSARRIHGAKGNRDNARRQVSSHPNTATAPLGPRNGSRAHYLAVESTAATSGWSQSHLVLAEHLATGNRDIATATTSGQSQPAQNDKTVIHAASHGPPGHGLMKFWAPSPGKARHIGAGQKAATAAVRSASKTTPRHPPAPPDQDHHSRPGSQPVTRWHDPNLDVSDRAGRWLRTFPRSTPRGVQAIQQAPKTGPQHLAADTAKQPCHEEPFDAVEPGVMPAEASTCRDLIELVAHDRGFVCLLVAPRYRSSLGPSTTRTSRRTMPSQPGNGLPRKRN